MEIFQHSILPLFHFSLPFSLCPLWFHFPAFISKGDDKQEKRHNRARNWPAPWTPGCKKESRRKRWSGWRWPIRQVFLFSLGSTFLPRVSPFLTPLAPFPYQTSCPDQVPMAEKNSFMKTGASLERRWRNPGMGIDLSLVLWTEGFAGVKKVYVRGATSIRRSPRSAKLARHILLKSPLAPLFQRGEFLPFVEGGEEGFSLWCLSWTD